jgi:hypothetical protein
MLCKVADENIYSFLSATFNSLFLQERMKLRIMLYSAKGSFRKRVWKHNL